MNKLVFPVKICFQFKENFEDFKKTIVFLYIKLKAKYAFKAAKST